MPIILIIVILSALKFFEVSLVANLSWWWIIGLAAIAFIWFEFIERMLGLDKRKAHSESERLRAERVKKTFEKK